MDQNNPTDHNNCWNDRHQSGETVWFDSGVICKRPEWH